jgi:hypothetical protein
MEKGKFLNLPGLELRPLVWPARSQSLYRLHYLDCHVCVCTQKINVYMNRNASWEDQILLPVHGRLVLSCNSGRANIVQTRRRGDAQVTCASLETRTRKRTTSRHWFIRVWLWDWRDRHKSHMRIFPFLPLSTMFSYTLSVEFSSSPHQSRYLFAFWIAIFI